MDKKENPDCRTCRRRRIRCDLGRPACSKCVSRGLACPGYGRRIQWVNGVASRGRFKGHSAPSLDHRDVATGIRDASSTAMSGPGDEDSAQTDAEGASSGSHPEEVETSRVDDVETGVAGAVVLSQPRGIPELRGDDTAVFLDYYDKSIAKLMVWFDSDDNAYRSCALPLARRQPGLFLAIAAVSAYHNSSSSSSSPSLSPSFPDQARDRCLAVLSQSTQDLTRRLGLGTGASPSACADNTSHAEWLLASILVISTYEMVRGRILASEGHKRAARSLLNLFTAAPQSDFFIFLRNQLAIHDVLSSITSFRDPSDLLATVTPYHTPRALFTHYLALVHRVTLLSRNLPIPIPTSSHSGARGWEEDGDDDEEGYSLATPLAARDAFEQARAATLVASAHLDFPTRALRRDFTRIVDIFHSAALLYAYRCLGFIHHECPPGDDSDSATAALEHAALARRLLDQLRGLEDVAAWPQNLLWPAFIAGVECHGRGPAARRVVEDLCRSLHRVTRFAHYLGVLDFLQAFWRDPRPDWRALAAEWEAEGRRVLLS